MKESNKGWKAPKGLIIFAIVFSSIMLFFIYLFFTTGGRRIVIHLIGEYIYDVVDYEESKSEYIKNKNKKVKEESKDDSNNQSVNKDSKDTIEQVHILLIGVEEIKGASNTDAMIVATMDIKNKSVKLTSLMRDLYVEIPGYSNNKLNSVYAKGGIDLLYQTIDNNFGIELDGYLLVNFNAFEKIIDLMDGIEITLTKNEANYLNRTNYISKPKYRNVKVGTQMLNGNQVVGYSRVRFVSTGKESDDFGRTSRHRNVLNGIFDRLKGMNVIQLGMLMNNILTEVDFKTDISKSEFNKYLEEGMKLTGAKIKQMRVPSNGSYKNQDVRIGSYNQDVLVLTDIEATRKEIKEFLGSK